MFRSIIALFLFLSTDVSAQFPEFYVYLYKGEVSVLANNKKKNKVQPRQLIFSTDQLLLKEEKSEITLVDKSGNFVVVRGKGYHKVSDISTTSTASNSITQKYLRLVWEDLLDPTHTNKSKIESIAASWGGAVRSGCDITKFPKNGYKSSAETIHFAWRPSLSDSSYKFLIVDIHDNQIINEVVRDTQINVATKNLGIAGESFYWSIQPTENSCRSVPKYRIDLIDSKTENEQVQALKKTIPEQNDLVIYNLQIAELLGRQGFMDKAITYIEKADKAFR